MYIHVWERQSDHLIKLEVKFPRLETKEFIEGRNINFINRTQNSDFVVLTPITANHNNGSLKVGICGLTLYSPQYKLNQ